MEYEKNGHKEWNAIVGDIIIRGVNCSNFYLSSKL